MDRIGEVVSSCGQETGGGKQLRTGYGRWLADADRLREVVSGCAQDTGGIQTGYGRWFVGANMIHVVVKGCGKDTGGGWLEMDGVSRFILAGV